VGDRASVLPFSIGRGKMVGGADEKLNNIVPLINKNFGIFLLLKKSSFLRDERKKGVWTDEAFFERKTKRENGTSRKFWKESKEEEGGGGGEGDEDVLLTTTLRFDADDKKRREWLNELFVKV
jgi:hypothetical protein